MDPSLQSPSSQDSLPMPAVPSAAAPSSNVPIPQNIPPAQTQNTTNQPVTPSQSGHSPHSPAVADDVDLIEKEWVIKAKAIVSKTKDDPSQQNRDINSFKADYLKTRYSKDIKINES